VSLEGSYVGCADGINEALSLGFFQSVKCTLKVQIALSTFPAAAFVLIQPLNGLFDGTR